MLAWFTLFAIFASVAIILSLTGATQGGFLTTLLASIGILVLLMLMAIGLAAKRLKRVRHS